MARRSIAPILAAALLAGGCGSDADDKEAESRKSGGRAAADAGSSGDKKASGPSKADFIVRAERTCQNTARRTKKLERKLDRMETPDTTEEVNEIGRLLRDYAGLLERTGDKLGRGTPPAEDRKTFRAYLGSLRDLVATAKRTSGAIFRQDSRRAQAEYEKFKRDLRRLKQLGRTYGLRVCAR